MRIVLRAFLLTLLSLPLLALAAVWLCFQDRPAVVRSVQLTPQDVENARRLIDRQDPRNVSAGGRRAVAVSEQELDLMLNYAANRFANGAARAALRSGAARLQASVEVPQSPFGRFVNVDAVLRESAALPRFERLRIGSLPVPGALADYALRAGLRRLAATEPGRLAAEAANAADAVRSVEIAEGRLTVTYAWTGDLVERARSALLSPAEQARMRTYHDRLVAVVAAAPSTLSLAKLMPPLFALAQERGASGDMARENRAAIVVLALYVNRKTLSEITPAAGQWPPVAPRRVTLAGRDDFPKHFLISAAVAAGAGGPLADAVGLQKEIADSRGGSGFSFNDIGADRAGTRFGEVAVLSPGRARELARAIAGGVAESDFMPDVADLPEYMQEAEFRRRFGDIGSPAYSRMMAVIDARVAATPLLR